MKINFRSYIYDVYIINFCRPDTRVFYFFVQKEGHHLAASLLISLCQEHFICPVCDNCTALVVCPYMRVFPLLNRSDVSNSKTTIYVPEQSRQLTFIPCQTCALCKSRMKVSSYIYQTTNTDTCYKIIKNKIKHFYNQE